MKILALVLLALTLGASNDAPADRYFGRLEMSALRIRYEIMQLRPRYETHHLLPEQAEHLLALDENAFYAWAAAYPKDSWLASTGYLLAGLYAELPGNTARDGAVRAYTYVKTHFPSTSYGKESVRALHAGIAVKADPAWAASMRASEASPAPSASPASSAAPSPPAPDPTSSPVPSASPRGSAATRVRIATQYARYRGDRRQFVS